MAISHPHSLYFLQPKCPPHYDDLFPPRYSTLCLVTAHISHIQPYVPPESFHLDPPPPYSLVNPFTQTESSDSDVFPSDSPGINSNLDWDL